MIEANLPWPLIALGVAVLLLAAWWLIAARRKTRVVVDRRDTLDEGAAPAARNQALIDAPPAALARVAPAARTDAPMPAMVAGAPEELPLELGHGDDLSRIKGLGPKLAQTLGTLGVTRFDQIAAWTDADIDRIDGQLGRFAGRIRRDDWVAQAKFLAADDRAGFAARFGAH